MRKLQTVDDVIDELGGTVETSRKARVSPSQVSGWRSARRLGSKSYLIIQEELAARGCTAPASLWGIDEPERQS